MMSGERDSTEPLDCQEVGLATLNLPEKLPARSPIRVKFAINQDGRLNVSADRPDRRQLDRRRVPDRGRPERRGGRGAIDGAAAADGIVMGDDSPMTSVRQPIATEGAGPGVSCSATLAGMAIRRSSSSLATSQSALPMIEEHSSSCRPYSSTNGISRLLGRIVEVNHRGTRISRMVALGSTTLQREDLDRGLEADECFYIANARQDRRSGTAST